jgi:DNA-binding NarL/FixJ family response regulator
MNGSSVVLADDHTMFLDVLVNLLGKEYDIVGIARDGSAMVRMVTSLKPDIVVADVSMPELSGIEAARLLRRDQIPTKILFLTMYAERPLVEEAFRAGASGYLLKTSSAEELVKAMQCVSCGGKYITPLCADLISGLVATRAQHHGDGTLTARQKEVLQLLASGKTMKEIGEVLNITTRTTESHKYEIMRTLGVKTTAELIRYALRVPRG